MNNIKVRQYLIKQINKIFTPYDFTNDLLKLENHLKNNNEKLRILYLNTENSYSLIYNRIIINTYPKFETRLYALLHEGGHSLHLPAGKARFSNSFSNPQNSDYLNAKLMLIEEYQANKFAEQLIKECEININSFNYYPQMARNYLTYILNFIKQFVKACLKLDFQ